MPLILICEAEGQPVKQGRVRGRVRLRPHIFEGGHKAVSEQLVPDPVDQRAGRQGVFRACQPPGKTEPVFGPFLLPGVQDGRGRRFKRVARGEPVSPLENARGALHVAGVLDHDGHRGGFCVEEAQELLLHLRVTGLPLSGQVGQKGKPGNIAGARLPRQVLVFCLQIQPYGILFNRKGDFPDDFPIGLVDSKPGQYFALCVVFAQGHHRTVVVRPVFDIQVGSAPGIDVVVVTGAPGPE